MIYKSDILAAIHETASEFHEAGLMPMHTMRLLDELCLPPVEEEPQTENFAARADITDNTQLSPSSPTNHN